MPSDPIGIDLGVTEGDLLAALDARDAGALATGALDPGEVWFEFVTQEDDKVRPGHAALHGTVWRVGDPAAPVPPIDYGCRCGMRYVAPPGGRAEKYLPKAPTTPKTHAEVLAAYLADRLGMTPAGVQAAARSLEGVTLADRLGAATLRMQAWLRKMGEPDNLTQARPLARMVLAIQQPRPADAEPAGGETAAP